MRDLDRHPRDLLALQAEGGLDRVRAARVAEHVAACASCARELERWRTLYAGLARLPRPAAPPTLRVRILEAVARENARARVLAEARRRRLVAALSWAYGTGLGVAAALVLGLAFVPQVRQAAGSALAMASATGLRAGLAVIDSLSLASAWADAAGRFIGDQFAWVRTVGRALETVGGATGAGPGGWIVLTIGVVISSLVFVRFLHQRDPDKEVPHVGPMVA
jgi:predicted anti-sigma-YlaC factor YlaD